jgi:hypothetical protein
MSFLFDYLVDNGTIVYIPPLENQSDFWDAISIFQSAVLSAYDLFISTPPVSMHNRSKI